MAAVRHVRLAAIARRRSRSARASVATTATTAITIDSPRVFANTAKPTTARTTVAVVIAGARASAIIDAHRHTALASSSPLGFTAPARYTTIGGIALATPMIAH